MSKMLHFAGQEFEAAGEAGLYWPAERALLVADLHLEKGSSFAAHSGQMLPPYDSAATLAELEQVVASLDVEQVICLGDNFHDDAGEDRLTGEATAKLLLLTSKYDWHWIVGNHDPDIGTRWGGSVHQEIDKNGIMLRHEVCASDSRPEISGHYHPKLRMRLRKKMVSRKCFLVCGNRMVMPAFGVFTGGMDVMEILELLPAADDAYALVPVNDRIAKFAFETAV